MSTDSAHQSKWEIGEVVFGIPNLVGVALHFLFPIPIARGIVQDILLWAGVILIVIGFSLIAQARREFARFKQPTDPGQPTGKVIKTGIFAKSRNPLYLACIPMFLGLALILNMAWTLAALALSMLLCHYILILPEERYLTAKFGEEYKEYMASVNRWIGHQ